MNNTIRVNHPEPYYLAFDCLDIIHSQISGMQHLITFVASRAAPFLEDLPVVIMMPLYLGVQIPTLIGAFR